MKILKSLAILAMSTGLMIGTNSCFVHVLHNDSGSNQRTGSTSAPRQKNSNNPHTPNTTNPGHTKSPKQSKGNSTAPR